MYCNERLHAGLLESLLTSFLPFNPPPSPSTPPPLLPFQPLPLLLHTHPSTHMHTHTESGPSWLDQGDQPYHQNPYLHQQPHGGALGPGQWRQGKLLLLQHDQLLTHCGGTPWAHRCECVCMYVCACVCAYVCVCTTTILTVGEVPELTDVSVYACVCTTTTWSTHHCGGTPSVELIDMSVCMCVCVHYEKCALLAQPRCIGGWSTLICTQ